MVCVSKPPVCDMWVPMKCRQNLETRMISVIILAIIIIILHSHLLPHSSLLDNTYYTSSLSSGGRSSSFKCYHWVGCPRFFIFPVAEVASHVDGPLSCSVVKKFAVLLWDHIQHLVKSKFGVVGNISKYKSDLRRVFKLKCEVG